LLGQAGGSADAASATPRGITLGSPVTIDGMRQVERYVRIWSHRKARA